MVLVRHQTAIPQSPPAYPGHDVLNPGIHVADVMLTRKLQHIAMEVPLLM